MINESYPTLDSQKLKANVIEVIKNVNRVIYNWEQRALTSGLRLTVGHEEIRGMIINWFNRILRDQIGLNNVNRIFRHGKPFVTLDPKTGFVNNIRFCVISDYYSRGTALIRDDIQKILDEIDYSNYHYNIDDYKLDNLKPVASYDNGNILAKIDQITFGDISAIKF